jgi:hypothetical protein
MEVDKSEPSAVTRLRRVNLRKTHPLVYQQLMLLSIGSPSTSG